MVALHSSDGKQGFSLESARHCGTLDRRPVRMGIFQCGISRRAKKKSGEKHHRTSFFAAVGIFHVDGWYKSKTEAGEGIKKTLVRFFIPSLYHHTKFFCFFVQMRVYDRGFAVFRFHHDGPNALILAEREREGFRQPFPKPLSKHGWKSQAARPRKETCRKGR